MENKDKERLIDLIDEYTEPLSARDIHKADFAEKFADYLLKNGVCFRLIIKKKEKS